MTPTPAAPSGELLPCPYCGGIPKLFSTGATAASAVNCLGCDAYGPSSIGAVAAVESWNRRAAVSQAAPEQAVRYEIRMRAPNENIGPWYECTEAAYKQFTANGNIGDGFFNETRALGVIALAAPSGAPKQEKLPVELLSVREQIDGGAGFWHSCSGCHDTEDGHPTGNYHYSDTMRCALGSGCSECGGIGAIWDNNDYSEIVEEESRALAAPSGAPKQPQNINHILALLAQYHQEVWDVAQSDHPIYDEAGRNTAKELVAAIEDLAAASTVQSAPVLPECKPDAFLLVESDGSYSLVRSNFAELSTGKYNLYFAAQSTPVQVDGQQEQTLQPSCDSALHAEPAGQHKIPEPGYSDSLADRVFNLSCNWKGDQRLFDAVLMGHCMACEQAYDLVWTHEQTRSAGSARQGGEHAPEIVQAGALLIPGMVYVCPERDIECGEREKNWCNQCPKKRALALPVAAAPEKQP